MFLVKGKRQFRARAQQPRAQNLIQALVEQGKMPGMNERKRWVRGESTTSRGDYAGGGKVKKYGGGGKVKKYGGGKVKKKSN